MKRDSYADQKSPANFQPKSAQPASEPTQFGQPAQHSSSTGDLGASRLGKAKGWAAGKFQAAQNFVNGLGDSIAPDQVLPALKGTALSHQPLVGVIDSGFGANEHGQKMVEAIQKENPQAQIWKGGGVGTGVWSKSLVDFVETAKASGQPHAVANLSFDLTEVHPDGSTSNRSQLTADEQSALAYARDNHVLVVASSGNQGGKMSALGQASQRSDNLIVVGAADGSDRASYSSYGKGLDLVAEVGSVGTSLAAAKATGTIANMWSDNPGLSDRQISQILTATPTDLNKPGWDAETGSGLLNPKGAIELAKHTAPETSLFSDAPLVRPGSSLDQASSFRGKAWTSTDGTIASERPNWGWSDITHAALDVAGFVPVVGAAADVANGALYLAEGNPAEAALSFVAAVPGVGDAIAIGAKGVKATKAVVEGVEAAKVTTMAVKPAVAAVKPAAVFKPAIAVKPPVVAAKPVTIAVKPPTIAVKPPTVAAKPPAIAAKPPTIEAKPPTVAAKPPTIAVKPPTVAAKPPDVTGKKGFEASPSSSATSTATGSASGKSLLTKATAATTAVALVGGSALPIVSNTSNPQPHPSATPSQPPSSPLPVKPPGSTSDQAPVSGTNPSGSNPAPTGQKPPNPVPPSQTPLPPSPKPPSSTPGQVTIRSGDTLWKIAQDNLGSGDRWHELRKSDGSSFTEQEAGRLQVGTSILISDPHPTAAPVRSPSHSSQQKPVPNTQFNGTETPTPKSTQSPWSPPPIEQPDLTPYIHTTDDYKYAHDTAILSRLHEILPGESLSKFANRIRTRILDKNGVELTHPNQPPTSENTGGGTKPSQEILPLGTGSNRSPISPSSEHELSTAIQSAQIARERLVGVSDPNKTETHAATENGPIIRNGRKGGEFDRKLSNESEIFMYENGIEVSTGRPQDSHAERKAFINAMNNNPDQPIIAIGVDRPICDAGGTSGGECTHFFEEAAQATGKTIVIAEMDPKTQGRSIWTFRPGTPPEKQAEK